MDARHGQQSVGATNGPAAARPGSAFRLATSCRAVATTLGSNSTRTVEPRRSSAARRPAATTNSNPFKASGRLTMRISVRISESASEHPRRRRQGPRPSHARARVEIRISLRSQGHEAFTSSKALVRAQKSRRRSIPSIRDGRDAFRSVVDPSSRAECPSISGLATTQLPARARMLAPGVSFSGGEFRRYVLRSTISVPGPTLQAHRCQREGCQRRDCVRIPHL